MKLINNPSKLNGFIKKYQLEDFFSKDITPQMKLFLFTQGEYIYQDGDVLNYFYFFVEGKAKIYDTLANGKSHLLSFYEPLKVLGDAEIINNDSVKVNVKVITDVYCIGISSDYVKSYLLNDPLFLRFLCSRLGKKLNRCSKNSSINLLYPLESKLASYILAIETKAFMKSNTLTFYDSLTEISELLGCSYRHLLRTIHDFLDKGILLKGPKGYEIIDKKPLLEIASDLYTT